MRQLYPWEVEELGPFGAEVAGFGYCEHGVREGETLYSVMVECGPDLVGHVEPANDNGAAPCRAK